MEKVLASAEKERKGNYPFVLSEENGKCCGYASLPQPWRFCNSNGKHYFALANIVRTAYMVRYPLFSIEWTPH